MIKAIAGELFEEVALILSVNNKETRLRAAFNTDTVPCFATKAYNLGIHIGSKKGKGNLTS